ncbi:MAG TPA: hypothetical protein VKX33_08845 [Cyclobacteriaceae bacterium]|nr:hypothetical protein [Cyclobacteriaceae bacterium]
MGLGWLGMPLAKFLMEKGFEIRGSTTSAEKGERLKEKGINAYPFFLNPKPEGEGGREVFDADVLIINIPPKSRTHSEDYHLLQLESLKNLITLRRIPKVIFVSATSVYPDLNGEALESDLLCPSNTGNRTLLEAENLLWKEKSYELTVIRLGGLLGDDRIPGLYVSNKVGVVGHAPVNYIYRDDAVRLLHWVIDVGLWNETFNGVAPHHPLRREVYEKNAKDLDFPPPISYASPAVQPWKIVSSRKIIQTGFTFLHHPLNFPYSMP